MLQMALTVEFGQAEITSFAMSRAAPQSRHDSDAIGDSEVRLRRYETFVQVTTNKASVEFIVPSRGFAAATGQQLTQVCEKDVTDTLYAVAGVWKAGAMGGSPRLQQPAGAEKLLRNEVTLAKLIDRPGNEEIHCVLFAADVGAKYEPNQPSMKELSETLHKVGVPMLGVITHVTAETTPADVKRTASTLHFGETLTWGLDCLDRSPEAQKSALCVLNRARELACSKSWPTMCLRRSERARAAQRQPQPAGPATQ
eukprot:TRINITY_DN4526_c0_g3_i1.p1 TRINITY_DN4526_c0_g3~~TRINITY_DN4526_c0_g3_i1.p1  ORF type:complete len:255 (-),score=44.63 TRINITY_DN4526_c0_g3_i1:185-949(-)